MSYLCRLFLVYNIKHGLFKCMGNKDSLMTIMQLQRDDFSINYLDGKPLGSDSIEALFS